MIPSSSDYPETFDTDENLFVVHDSLRLRLVEDYALGDSTIQTQGSILVAAIMPPTGIITLTEQCSDLDERAISFHYTGFDDETLIFSGLELLPEFDDVAKPKRITNVTLNVMARHHDHIKNALIEIQEFCGVEGTEDTLPFGPTLEGRINFLRRIVLQPKAWFSSDKRTGNVPLEIEFVDMSFRLGTDGNTGDVLLTWDFGDQTTSIISFYSLISADDSVPDSAINVLVRDIDGGTINKTYHQPGLYDVKLTVENDFGSDTIIFEDFINVRVKAPNDAIIRFIENTSVQDAQPGVPEHGPFEITPTIRSPINTLIQMEIAEGENPNTPGYSYAGEILNEAGDPIDGITNWTWALGDDLSHSNNRTTSASYSVGGVYDLKLRVDTEFNAFRITTYENAIDIVENRNLWFWIFQNSNRVRAYEYGLISETFKVAQSESLVVNRNSSFLDNVPNATQQTREFNRNNGFTPRSTTNSGAGGESLLFWASGRNESDLATSEEIKVVQYSGLTGQYVSKNSITRQWNWANLNSASASYFVFGAMPTYAPNTSYTNIVNQELELTGFTVTNTPLVADDYLNGAIELEQNVSAYATGGDSTSGHFSVYRTAWKDNSGYIARNNGIDAYFRIKSFYRTEGTLGTPFKQIKKLMDIQGPTKIEGQLTNLSTGIYFLNNSGSVSKFSDTDDTWTTGGPGVNSLLYRSLQDTTVSGFDDQANTLLLTSDDDKRAYLSFDYSPNAFLKFNEIDLTFSSLGSRPEGEQWVMGIY